MIKKVKKGFTLIELLIVVSIIGILSVALVPSITDAPKRARDAARKTMVNTIVAAVESYNLDTGSYPAGTFCVDDTETGTTGESELVDLIGGAVAPKSASIDTALTTVGEDLPCTNATNTFVFYKNTGAGYTVAIRLEKSNGNYTYASSAFTASPTNVGNVFAVVR